MLIDVELKSKLNENDIIVCRNGKWIIESYAKFVNPVVVSFENQVAKLESEIEDLKNELKRNEAELCEYKAKVNQKFKEHHEALNALIGDKK